MSVTLTIDVGAAPQGGSESITATNYANRAAFATAAATAQSSAAGFIAVQYEKEGKAYEELINLNKVRSVV